MKAPTLLHRVAAVSVLLLACAGALNAQEEGGQGVLAPVAAGFAQEPGIPEALQAEEDLHAEMIELLHQIEGTLIRIDVDLGNAGAGEAPLESVEGSGIQDLLLSSRRQMQSVVESIDRILEIRQHHQSGGTWPGSGRGLWLGGGNGAGQPSQSSSGQWSSSGSPLDQVRDRGPTAREQTPEGPKKDGQEQDSSGQRPDSPLDSDDSGETLQGDRFDFVRGNSSAADPDADEWGMLPQRTREMFRNKGSDDLPVQYRDWIDAYYRRLNRVK